MYIQLPKFKLLTSLIILVPILCGCGNQSSINQAANIQSVKVHAMTKSTVLSANKNWIADPQNYIKSKTLNINDSVSVPILEYHEANYVPGDIATLKPGEFASQLEWLHRNRFHTINFGQLYAAMYYGYTLPTRPILLTFDDGYESIYFKVFPLLKKYQDEATLFVVSNFTHDTPNRTVKFPTLTKSELTEMETSGLVDIESHTMDHKDLSTLSDNQAIWEITKSASFLEKITNHKITFFCYPDGGYTVKTMSLLKNAGYFLAVTQHQGYANISQGPFSLKRISVLDNTTLSDFEHQLNPSLIQNSQQQSAQSTVNNLYQKGVQAFSSKNYPLAIQLESKAIEQDATFYQAYNMKGIALCYSGDFRNGIAFINKSLQISPNYGYGLFNKALALELYAHYDEAIDTYHQAIALHTKDWWVPWCYYGIASIYGRRGDVLDSVNYLKQAIHMSPSIKYEARTEKDFNNVKNSPAFQAVIR